MIDGASAGNSPPVSAQPQRKFYQDWVRMPREDVPRLWISMSRVNKAI